MASVVLKTDPSQYRLSVNTPDFDPADWLINPPGLPALLGAVAPKYWKISGSDVVEMDQAEKDAVDAAELAADVAAAQAGAKESHDATTAEARALRATVKILVDELNLLRQWITQYKADVAAAANLAQLQASVAASADLPERTYADARTAIRSRIDGE